jgi:DNA sulfur modification protein DndB
MCPICLLPRLFPIDDATSETHQSFRNANRTRVREIVRYIVENPTDYHFAPFTVSVESKVRFVPAAPAQDGNPAIGQLFIPLESRFTLHDAVERIIALQRALTQCKSLASDCVAMLIHIDPGGKRRGQIFSDVKRHERAPAQSLRISLDDRDETAKLTREVIAAVPVFADSTEFEKTTISNRSRKLFTLSALYQANGVLLADQKDEPYKNRLALAIEFWTEVSRNFPTWTEIVKGDESAAEIRARYVHCHAIGLSAIARAGRSLLSRSETDWKKRIKKLSTLDWSRSNMP